MRAGWGYHCPVKQLLYWYGLVCIAYTSLLFFMSPEIEPQNCEEYISNSSAVMPMIISWLGAACDLMLLALQFFVIALPGADSPNAPRIGMGTAFACLALALLPGFTTAPNCV